QESPGFGHLEKGDHAAFGRAGKAERLLAVEDDGLEREIGGVDRQGLGPGLGDEGDLEIGDDAVAEIAAVPGAVAAVRVTGAAAAAGREGGGHGQDRGTLHGGEDSASKRPDRAQRWELAAAG